jgi:hypothetical protein
MHVANVVVLAHALGEEIMQRGMLQKSASTMPGTPLSRKQQSDYSGIQLSAVYARFSGANQHESSIEGQICECRKQQRLALVEESTCEDIACESNSTTSFRTESR